MALKKNISDIPLLRHYDKLLVVLALVVLLVSLAYLIRVGFEHENSVLKYEDQINSLKPTSGAVEAINMVAYGQAAKQLEVPFKMTVADRAQANFLAPESRVACINTSCRKPIPEKAEVCPFCGDKQEGRRPPEDHATVGVVPDKVKRDLGLPINDASVEDQDLDGDGFTLREEFLAKTDPKDPKSHLPYSEKLQIKELRGKKLTLRFTAVNKMPDGNQLTFNWTDPKSPRTYWIRENQPIGETGYTAGQLEVKFEEQEVPIKRRVDVSTVKVKRNSDGKEIELQINEMEKNTDVEAILVFLVDNSELTLLEKQEFKLRDETYRVVSINERDTTVVVENTDTGKQKTIEK